MDLKNRALREIRDIIVREYRKGRMVSKRDIARIKRNVAKKYRLPVLPRDYEIFQILPEDVKRDLRDFLKSKPVRTASGVAVVSVMTKPLPCPGQCIYCPGGVDSFRPSPKSYTGLEPAARRAYQFAYDPYLQVKFRIQQLEAIGHIPQKIEIIVMGGTFLAAPFVYKRWFIRGIYEGLLGKRYPDKSLEELQIMLETAKYRLVGLTIETRPDFCKEKHVDEMLSYGTTRVEIGVQTLHDDVLKFVKRGHDVKTTREAFRITKDAGLKIVAHMMLNLPPPDPDRDIEDFRILFEDPDFRPDMLKIYPTAVIEGTELCEMWKRGEYIPYPDDILIETIAKIKRFIPPWVRIQRVQRDIPLTEVVAGYSTGSLREVVRKYMQSKGWRCRCIRCREVGLNYIKYGKLPDEKWIKPVIRKYEASLGEEIFISFEDIKNDILIGFIRLRKPSEYAHRKEVTQNTMLIRELHVYGPLVPIGEKPKYEWQHKGYGAKLLNYAEKIAVEEYDAKKILIISGIGVREYYRKFGYKREGPYMSKKFE